jgi:K(+)-stimulated pyrophosphate-energized sodium pump
VILGISLIALLFAWYLVREVLAAPEGSPKMKEIARSIQIGAKAYLNRQFRTVAVFMADPARSSCSSRSRCPPTPSTASSRCGSVARSRSSWAPPFSAITGYTGMWLAVRRTFAPPTPPRSPGLRRALRIAFRAGGVAGMFTVGLGLSGRP